jgi:hypothetical protein
VLYAHSALPVVFLNRITTTTFFFFIINVYTKINTNTGRAKGMDGVQHGSFLSGEAVRGLGTVLAWGLIHELKAPCPPSTPKPRILTTSDLEDMGDEIFCACIDTGVEQSMLLDRVLYMVCKHFSKLSPEYICVTSF